MGTWVRHPPKEWPTHCVCLQTLPQRRIATSCHTPGCRRPFFSRAQQSLSAFGLECQHRCHARTPETLPSRTAPTLIAESASEGRVGSGLAQLLPPSWTPSIITAAATAQGQVMRSVIPTLEQPCFDNPQGVPHKPCATSLLTKPHGHVTRCPPRQPSAVLFLPPCA